ncbi:MAG: M23 family metallopeptidase, partial [Deltaproteobacteria bacterium]|nr:M23 family metallopeptidase [Nannocystaceae bacterium]
MLSALLLASLLVAPTATTSTAKRPKLVDLDAVTIAKAPAIAVPAGYGRYCSMSYESGGWAFQAMGPNEDPCADILSRSPGGKIARAGLWSMDGGNEVVYRCGGGVGLLKGDGYAILKAAYDDSVGKQNCVITVAPKSLPIFESPFTAAGVSFSQGVDFAFGYSVKDNNGHDADAVNYKGKKVSYNNHDGMDWPMAKGKRLDAVADGVVLLARSRNVQKYYDAGCPHTEAAPVQNEIYVLHVVGSGAYAELFVTYYAHFSAMSVSTGDVVTRGQKLGEAGSTGCSTTSHLHLTVSRFSNTAARYRRRLAIPATEDY